MKQIPSALFYELSKQGSERPHLLIPSTWVFFFLNKFIYLLLAVSGLRCCAQAFSSCGEQGLLFVVVHRLLSAVASLVAEHRL